jgi:Uma2 family endonuclease
MVEVKLGQRVLQLPYTIRVPGVSSEQFDDLVNPDIKAEWIHGVMVVRSPESLRHSEVANFLSVLFSNYLDSKGLGGVILGPYGLVRLNEKCRLAPDLFFLGDDKVVRPLPEEYSGAPDLVLEVLSPSSRDDDLLVKRPVYRQSGVGEIWFVDLDKQQVSIDRKRKPRYVEEIIIQGWVDSQTVPGFGIDVAWLWQDPLPNRARCLQEILR